jgi:hypothetical protein
MAGENLENIPAEIRALPQWVLYKLEAVDGRQTKVPYTTTECKADTTNPQTWATFESCRSALSTNRFSGLGFVFADGGNYTGIDLDKHRDLATGELDEFAAKYVSRVNSYTEASQSGAGVHIIAHANIPGGKGRRDAKTGVEMYSKARFFVMTGDHVEGTPRTVEPRQQAVEEMFQEIFPPKAQATPIEQSRLRPLTLTDLDLIDKASLAVNGAKFSALWRGDFAAAGYGSQSEADAGLLALLYFWTVGDKARSFALFEQSGLNRDKWQREDYRENTWQFVAQGETYSPDVRAAVAQREIGSSTAPASTAVISAINDPRPKIELPGDNRLLSDFARDLGKAIRYADIFQRDGMVFVVNDRGDGLTPMTAATLRSWLEQHLVCYKRRFATSETIQFRRTMTAADASGVLNSPQFISQLREICRFNPVPMPVRRLDGRIEMLKPGYDEPSKSFTASNALAVDEDMALGVARGVIDDMLAEFKFVDEQRSKSVAIAAMLTVFALGILPSKSLRPCFVFLANAEGAGKSLLVKIATVPVLGYFPASTLPKDEDEMRKVLLSAIIEAKPVLCFDNFKGRLQSESLEGFLTSQDWSGRILGGQATFRGDNNVIVFVTGNSCTVSPDMRRRSLFCELFLEVERAEDRQFKNLLEVSVLLGRRIDIMSALWALIREWHNAEEPKPSRSNSSFPEWSNTFAATVEHAGYGCPLETPKNEASADTDGDDMRELVKSIAGDLPSKTVTFEELIKLAEAGGQFEWITTGLNTEKGRASSRATLGRILRSYDRRLVGGYRFTLVGKGHQRRFQVEKVSL